MDANTTAALERLRGLMAGMENALPGPEVMSTTSAEEAAFEVADAFWELDRLLSVAGPDVRARRVDSLTVGVTIGGVDVYVRDTPGSVIVSVGTDELPEGKTAAVESFDGVSWEHDLP
jgi:hypothetical protein